MIGIAKIQRKYSNIIIEANSSSVSVQQKSASRNPKTPPQVSRANRNMITIHVMTLTMYNSAVKFILKISNPLTKS